MSCVELICVDTKYVSYMQDAYTHAAIDTTCVTAWNFTE